MVETSGLPRWGSFWLALAVGFGLKIAPAADKAIQDNSFLLEEAYNQERGVVQHISTFTRSWNSNDWCYSFTEEWPGLHNPRHQFSYTLTGVHAGAFTGIGLGDTALHYRYQWIGSGDTPLAIAPRFSVLVPSGSVEKGRGTGGAGVQLNVPASVVVSRLHRHPLERNRHLCPARPRCRAPSRQLTGLRVRTKLSLPGPSAVQRAAGDIGGRLSGCYRRGQNRMDADCVPESRGTVGLQPRRCSDCPRCCGAPGFGPSRGTHSLFVYLSFEHAFR